ncbi:MAG: rhomboid family intramembrane serine protease [Bacteroidales bacterium]|nr:rhomboid family intramembrane serine protease [Bacteroidales bacterium]MCD8395507.1 rhomboid family intramembrane serine protease [Bacteroidales bacterium]
MPPVTKHLLIINLIIWLVANVSMNARVAIQEYGALYYFTSVHFNPAQLLTYMFIQVDFLHLFFNMFALFMFGMSLERVMGSGRFLFFYVACGLGAALIQEGVFAIMVANYVKVLPPELVEMANKGMYSMADPTSYKLAALVSTPVIGASGSVYGILLGFAMIFPNLPLYIWFIPIPIKAKWVVTGYAVLELVQAVSNNPGDNVAHVAHLGGMIFGLIMILYWKKHGDLHNGYY